MITPVTHSAQGSRLNRRGRETRRLVLDVAIRCLANGGPEAVSANLIAREAGVTWGTIQHQFGDSDGVWAALLDHASTTMSTHLPTKPRGEKSLARRVGAIVDTLWASFDTPSSRAIENLRRSLPRDPAVLAKDFPATTEALRRIDDAWTAVFDELLDGLVTSKIKLRRVRSLIPGALRGIHTQAQVATRTDAEEAKRGLTEALVAYLSS